MAIKKFIPSLGASFCVALLSACASAPANVDAPGATSPPVAAAPAPSTAKPDPAAQTEAETATALEKKFQDAARGYKVVERDGKTLYCKREKPMGSTIPRMQCMTESQLRTQVETMDDARDRMRNNGKCTLGAGCRSGG